MGCVEDRGDEKSSDEGGVGLMRPWVVGVLVGVAVLTLTVSFFLLLSWQIDKITIEAYSNPIEIGRQRQCAMTSGKCRLGSHKN